MTESYNNNLLLTQPLTQLSNNDNDSPMEITPMSELSSSKSVINSEITNNNQEQLILEKYAENIDMLSPELIQQLPANENFTK
jgi:hypothetical protein